MRVHGFSLGIAGVLFAGIAVGALDPRLKLPEPIWVLGRTGSLVWQVPYTANLTLRQLGTVLFLAGIGTRSGDAFAHTITDPQALVIVGAGLLITCVVVGTALVGGLLVLRLPPRVLAGAIAGMQSMIVKILVAQLLLEALC